MARSELARALRSARHERRITQSRLSARLGVPVALVERWELGEAAPTPLQMRALAEALGVKEAALDAAAEQGRRVAPRPLAEGTVTVEILPTRAGVAVAEPAPPPPHPEAGRGAERRSRERARRAAHSASNTRRRSVERAGDEARRLSGRTSTGVPAPPVFAPDLLEERSHVIATVNSGSVFPVPGSRRTIDKLTYSTGAPTYRATPEDRMVYRSRWMRVVLIMIGLVALLWWAVAQLGDGWGAVLDLFRSDQGPSTSVGAMVFGFVLPSG